MLTARRRKARPERRAFAFQVAVDDVAPLSIGEDVPGGGRVGIEQSSVTTQSRKLGGVRFYACLRLLGDDDRGTTLSASVSLPLGGGTYGLREPRAECMRC